MSPVFISFFNFHRQRVHQPFPQKRQFMSGEAMGFRKRSSWKVSDDQGGNRMDLLPPEVVLDILSRLPITSLMQFKSASHSCHDLSADPRLPSMFFNRVNSLNPSLILHSSSSHPNEVYILDIGSEVTNSSLKARKVGVNSRSHSKVSKFELVGSCNGLLCLCLPNPGRGGRLETHALQIYNPLAGDIIELPRATQYMNQKEVFGFGFHPRSREYKVVRIVSYTQIMTPAYALGGFDEFMSDGFVTVSKSAVQVFSLKTKAWRNKGPAPGELLDQKAPQALVEGSLHWVSTSNRIISFDLGDEVFHEVPCPETLAGKNWYAYNLTTLDGCLALSTVAVVDNVHIDIWTMKQYNVKESWVKELSFIPIVPPGSCDLDWNWVSKARYYRIICVMKNGEFLMQYDEREFISYDPVRKKFKVLQITGLPEQFHAYPFVPSLFSAEAIIQMFC